MRLLIVKVEALFSSVWLVSALLFVPGIQSAMAETNPQFLEHLRESERQWLVSNPKVRYTSDPHWLSFQEFIERGTHLGINADYLDLISSRTGIQFEKVHPGTWSDALALAEQGEVDMISGDSADEVLAQNYTVVKHYIRNKVSIVMRSNAPNIERLEDTKTARITFIRGHGYTQKLINRYPGIAFEVVDDIDDGLEQALEKRIDALLVAKSELYAGVYEH